MLFVWGLCLISGLLDLDAFGCTNTVLTFEDHPAFGCPVGKMASAMGRVCGTGCGVVRWSVCEGVNAAGADRSEVEDCGMTEETVVVGYFMWPAVGEAVEDVIRVCTAEALAEAPGGSDVVSNNVGATDGAYLGVLTDHVA